MSEPIDDDFDFIELATDEEAEAAAEANTPEYQQIAAEVEAEEKRFQLMLDEIRGDSDC